MLTNGRQRVMRTTKKGLVLAGGAFFTACVHTHIAMAQILPSDAENATDVADNASGTTASIGGYLPILAQVIGFAFAIMVAMKMRAHGKQETREPGQLKEALWTGIAAVVLFAIPEILGVGVFSLFSGGGSTAGVTADSFRN